MTDTTTEYVDATTGAVRGRVGKARVVWRADGRVWYSSARRDPGTTTTDVRLSSPWATRVVHDADGEACMVASKPGKPSRRRGTRVTSAFQENALWTGRVGAHRDQYGVNKRGKPVYARPVTSYRVEPGHASIADALAAKAAAVDAARDRVARRRAERLAERGDAYYQPTLSA